MEQQVVGIKSSVLDIWKFCLAGRAPAAVCICVRSSAAVKSGLIHCAFMYSRGGQIDHLNGAMSNVSSIVPSQVNCNGDARTSQQIMQTGPQQQGQKHRNSNWPGTDQTWDRSGVDKQSCNILREVKSLVGESREWKNSQFTEAFLVLCPSRVSVMLIVAAVCGQLREARRMNLRSYRIREADEEHRCLKDMRNNWWMWVTEFNPLKRILNYNASTPRRPDRTGRHHPVRQNQSRINWVCVAVLRNGSRISLFIDLEIVSISSSVPVSSYDLFRSPDPMSNRILFIGDGDCTWFIRIWSS